ncbi:hypothetical protein H1R20_g6526, partial [Candolleomyces eurysporus]
MPQSGSSTVPNTFSNKAPATFLSSLDILVEGTVPIESDSEKTSGPNEASNSKPAEPKRAPRKSKTEALTALNNQARSASVEVEEDEDVEDLGEQYRNAPPIPVSAKFDLSSVKTSSPARTWKQPPGPRPLDLQDCPEFFPTAEEFKDPMAYIKSISDKAKDYGICKIIPPENWKMPFVTDTESFRFKTRLQRLNSIEASSRAKLNFLEQLYRFHKQQGNPRVAVPTINNKPLDLWTLRKEVQRMGGYDAVTKGKKWSDLGRVLGYRGIPGLSTQIKNSYTRVILPFEHFCERAKNSPALMPLITRDAHLKMHANFQGPSKATKSEGTSTPGSPLTASSSPLSEPPDESESKDAVGSGSRPRRSTRMSSQEQSPKKAAPVVPPPTFYDKPHHEKGKEEQHCEICHKKNRGEEMLLCDGCDCGFHMFCLDPPLTAIPKEQWFCFTCLAGTGGDFGFDEGEEHSLSTFQARDLKFRQLWFETHPPPGAANRMVDDNDPTINRIGNAYISEEDVENEFWRLVASPNETVEIDAMPTIETHPLDPYSKDPWNLNNVPILPDSLLRYIKSDISGMTVPWTYVGMAFSTFCWHNEDHYTYSVNYMHWGETKTWYGIPGEDAEKFEAAIKCEAPDLFEAQPDLLFQLVTLMNPTRLTAAGVRVYRCNQRAGEFVITFPKAYHAGFNHGLNFNEAVNFALPDWLPLGRDCVQRYRDHRKLPVFSQDELLITITQQSSSIKTAMWEMVERELDDRAQARSRGLTEVLKEEDSTEDQYQCHVCKTFCYLSQVVCQCTNRVVCADHIDLLCENRPSHNLVLRKRFSDDELSETLAKWAERAAIPAAWRSKLQKLLLESSRPTLRSLRALLAEGDRINYPLPEMANLRKCVTRANEWVDFANSFIIRKQSRKRARRSRGRPSNAADLAAGNSEDPNDRPDRGLDELYAHLREVESLGFDCPEIGALKTLAQQAEETKLKAVNLLKASPEQQERAEFLQECKHLLLQGSSLNVILDELTAVEKIVDREQLVTELEEKLEDEDESSLTLEEVRQLLTRARACGLPSDNKHMKFLESRQRDGDSWEERAKSVLEQPIKTIQELDQFADMDPNIPIDPTILDRLMSARAKALDFKKQAKAWMAAGDSTGPKPRISEVLRLCQRSEKDFRIPEITELKRSADIATDLENRCEAVLRNRFPVAHNENIFDLIAEWKKYTRENLTIYSFPAFEKVCEQVRLHEQWLKELPWFCAEHNRTHSKELVQDVLECTRPDDDAPPGDEYYTCICSHPVRPPPPGVVSDAVQCDHCFARFHGECAKNGGSCPFCDHHHWNGTIHKQRGWHFCFLAPLARKAPEISRNYSIDFRELELIIQRVDRLSNSIGQFLSYTSQPAHQRPEFIPQVRHYMRKLYRIQFAVSPNPDISFGLDLAGLHRILAGRPPTAARPKKRRRPRFIFGQDIDSDWNDSTRCICRGVTGYLLNKPKVACTSCARLYHVGCVFFPAEGVHNERAPLFFCPICSLKKGRRYEHSDVRVRPSVALGRVEEDVYVNTTEMLDTFSRELIYKKLPKPIGRTLFVELVSWQPGSDSVPVGTPSSSLASSSSSSRSLMIHHHHHSMPAHPSPLPPPPPPPPVHTGHHGEQIMRLDSAPTITMYAPAPVPPPPPPAHNLAPPPWSRWGTVTTPSMPPQTQRRSRDTESRSSGGTPQPSSSSRKRKATEDSHSSSKRRAQPGTAPSTASSSRAPSNPPTSSSSHAPPPAASQSTPASSAGPASSPSAAPGSASTHAPRVSPASPISRPMQTLSPSLAMIVSPTNEEPQTSPRTAYRPPTTARNGMNGSSPSVPPAKPILP